MQENIFEDIKSGFVGVLRDGNMIMGTGSYKDNHITRVYVKPECQGKGYRSYIMQCLENQIRLQYNTVYLDASLPASHLYEKRGYQTAKHEKWNVENGRILVYEQLHHQMEERALEDAMLEIGYHSIKTLEHMLPNGKNWYR